MTVFRTSGPWAAVGSLEELLFPKSKSLKPVISEPLFPKPLFPKPLLPESLPCGGVKLGVAVETLGTVTGTALLADGVKLGVAVETLGTLTGTGGDGGVKLGAAVETLGTVKGTGSVFPESLFPKSLFPESLPCGGVKLGAAVETLGCVVIDSNEPDACEVVVNKGTEYVVPDAPDILLI